MTTLQDIVRQVLDDYRLTYEQLGIALGYPPGSARQTIYKIVNGTQLWMKREKFDILVNKFGADPATILSLRSGEDAPIRTKTPVRSAKKMPDFQGEDDVIPVFSFTVTEDGETHKKAIGSKLRPPALQAVRDAYAVYMPDESMMPRYRKGWLLWVNPVKPVSEGRDALILPKDSLPSVREIVRVRGRLVGRPLNKGATITLTEDTNRHLIVGADHEG